MCFFELSSSQRMCPTVGLLGHVLFRSAFSFYRALHTALHHGCPIYSPTNSAGGFPSGLRHFLKKGSNMSNIPHIVHMIGRSEKVKTSPECPIRLLNSLLVIQVKYLITVTWV